MRAAKAEEEMGRRCRSDSLARRQGSSRSDSWCLFQNCTSATPPPSPCTAIHTPFRSSFHLSPWARPSCLERPSPPSPSARFLSGCGAPILGGAYEGDQHCGRGHEAACAWQSAGPRCVGVRTTGSLGAGALRIPLRTRPLSLLAPPAPPPP